MKKHFYFICFLLGLFAYLIAAPVYAQDSRALEAFIVREMKRQPFKVKDDLWQESFKTNLPNTTTYVQNAVNLQLDEMQLQQFLQHPDQGIRLVIPAGNTTFEIDLAAYDILADGFEVATVANGVITPVEVSTGIHYRGVVAGVPGSIAAFSFYEDRVYGLFSLPGVGNFNLVRNTLMPQEDKQQYLLYNDKDMVQARATLGCSTDELPKLDRTLTAARNTYENCKDVEVYILADYATYVDANSDVNNVVSYVTALFNTLSTLYRNEGIYTSLKQLNVNTTSDVYQALGESSISFLETFGAATQNNLFGADVAHLISTRYGYLGGVAWLGTLCFPYGPVQQSGPYAFSNLDASEVLADFPSYSWNVEVMTHEMGHNLGSEHTHSCSWPGGAIDGCYTLEGACAMPVPQYPVAGGTIMSYCHLVNGVGINLANGFGPLPGDVVRAGVNGGSCVALYAPDALSEIAATVISANRECTDATGLTTYWYDNNNSSKADDQLALQLVKGANDIGNLDDVGFEVVNATTTNYGNNAGTAVDFPAGVPVGLNNIAMSRYWTLNPITQPVSTVAVHFPFSDQDITDVTTNIPAITDATGLQFYKFNANVDPNPENDFVGATSGNTVILDYTAGAASESAWAHTTSGNTHFANFLVSSFSGGGGFGSSSVPLPEEWAHFSGNVQQGEVVLNWEIRTANEIKEFLVEHADDGLHYGAFAVVAKSEHLLARYQVAHEQPVTGMNYYRLSYKTVDGKIVVAGFAQVNLQANNSVSIYPNPASGTLFIDLGGYGAAAIRIMDVQGRFVYQKENAHGLLKFNTADFVSGTYIIQVIQGNEVINQKVLLR